MAQQSSGEFASANPTKGEEDARVQERGIRAKISLNPRSHLQHLQRPTPSDISKNAPSLQGLSHAGVARSRRRRMISAGKPDEPASNFQQRDNALQALRSLRTEGPEIETARITRWCQTIVKPLVRQVIDTHDTDHVEIDQLLEEAKKG